VAREGKPFAISGERDASALLRQDPYNVTGPFQRLHAWQVVALIDFAAILEDGNALAGRCIRDNELQCLIAIEARVEQQGLDRDAVTGFLQGVLQAALILRDTVEERASDIENEALEHFVSSQSAAAPPNKRQSR